MPYDIELTATARRSLQRIPEKAVHAVLEFIVGALAENPQRVGKKLSYNFDGFWSARRAEYRVIYSIDEEANVVTVDSIGHRSDVYRRR